MVTLRSTGRPLSPFATALVVALGIVAAHPGNVRAADSRALAAASSASIPFPSTVQVDDANGDPCAVPPPLAQPINGMVTRRVTVLSGRINRLEVVQGRPARVTAFAPYGSLTFVTGSTAYVAPGYVFERGTTQRVCIAGPVAVLRARGGQPYGGPLRIVPARIDGTFVGATGRVTLTVGRAVYYVYGTTSTRTTTSVR